MNSNLLNKFFERIQSDPRVGTSHIALFTAMVQLSQDGLIVNFYGKELREIAKIGSSRTYFKILRDLKDGRYIDYTKGFSRWQKSMIQFTI